MEAFTTLQSLVVPLDRANVDTDAIIPKQFMKSILRTGFGDNLFDAWRFLDAGAPGQDAARHRLLNGLDAIALTLQRADRIRAFEAQRRAVEPWLFN